MGTRRRRGSAVPTGPPRADQRRRAHDRGGAPSHGLEQDLRRSGGRRRLEEHGRGRDLDAADGRPCRSLRRRARPGSLVAGHDLPGHGGRRVRHRLHSRHRVPEVDGRRRDLEPALEHHRDDVLPDQRPPDEPERARGGDERGSVSLDGRREHLEQRDHPRGIRGRPRSRAGRERSQDPLRHDLVPLERVHEHHGEGPEVDGRRRHVDGEELGASGRDRERDRRADVDRARALEFSVCSTRRDRCATRRRETSFPTCTSR